MEYINKQQILKKAKEHQNNPFGASLIIAEIEKADEDLIRCKDCRDYVPNVLDIGVGYCNENYREMREDGFCSYGKREKRGKIMTDEQTIKALECCISSDNSEACRGCPFDENDMCTKDSNALQKYALDLINRQKAEIEILIRKKETLRDELAEKDEKIAILTDQLSCFHLTFDGEIAYRRDLVKRVRADAVRETVERVKEYFNPDISADFRKWLSSLEKELMEGK